jgi:DNA-binding MarR family transcriptional regulator
MAKFKTPKQMERHLKGIANHYRIEILLIIAKNKEISLDEIIEKTKGNPKTIGEHTRRLFTAGLINKTKNGNFVLHNLSPYGRKFVNFLKSFQKQNWNT